MDEILEKIKTDQIIPPGLLADYKMKLSAEYSFRSSKLEEILRQKPDAWLEIRQREEINSDKQADRLWEATAFGKEEMSLKMQLKRIDKVISSISTRLRIYDREAKSQY